MKWAGHGICTGERSNPCETATVKREGKISFDIEVVGRKYRSDFSIDLKV
jgi:hypothetical protein